MAVGESVSVRFWSKVDVGRDNECWEWKGSINRSGYGNFCVGKNHRGDWVPIHAHRVALALVGSPPKPHMPVHHICENRRCVNPSHLKNMTNLEHHEAHGFKSPAFRNRDQWDTGECAKGHRLTADNIKIVSDKTRRCLTCYREYARGRARRIRDERRDALR